MSKGYYINSLEPDKPTKRCRKWRIRYTTGAKYSNGQPRCKCETFHGTRSAAEKHAQSRVIGRNTPSDYTVSAWCYKQNEEEYGANTVTLNTYKKRLCFIKNIDIHIGQLRLDELTPEHVLLMLSELSKGNSVSGKPLSGSTLQGLRACLRYLIQTAVNARIIPYNPVSLTKPPRNDTPERKALSDEQWHYLRSRLNPQERHELALLILLETGMREGEVCALKWSDITDDIYFYIHSSMQDNGVPKETKTTNSKRFVKISQFLRLRLLRAPHNGDYICGDPTHVNRPDRAYGAPLRPLALTAWWRRHRAEFGCDGYSLHEVGRHTTVTQMIRAGVDIKSACSLTGQSEITMLKVYAHASQKEASRDALDALQKIRHM